MTVARTVVVTGLVQGVVFRETCRREADRLGVTGWVRNNADGSVEAHFEGSEDAVAAMVRWAAHGPPDAVVRGVDCADEEPAGDTRFRVR